jgi:hypothetical protein
MNTDGISRGQPSRRRYVRCIANSLLIACPRNSARNDCDMLYGAAQSGCQKSLTQVGSPCTSSQLIIE